MGTVLLDGGMVLHHIINEGRHLQKCLPSFVIGEESIRGKEFMIKFMGPPLAPEHLLERKNLWAFMFAEGKIIVGVTGCIRGTFGSYLWEL